METEDILDSFQCRRCNECCRQPGFVYLTENETEVLAQQLRMEQFDFVNQYCELQDKRRLVLKKKNGEECIFLDKEGCAVYEGRPSQCRDFPRKWITERSWEYCEGLKALRRSRE